MGNCGNSFKTDSGDITGKINYVKSNGNIVTAGSFTGELLNCEFDCRGKSTTVINEVSSTAVIERCKLLSDLGPTFPTISSSTPVNVQILYTIINNGTNNITPIPATNYNLSTW
jgi:hypothetical protein